MSDSLNNRGSFHKYLDSLPTKDVEDIDGHVHVIPKSGRAHLETKDCWCAPEIIQDGTDTGGFLCYLHKEVQ